MYRMCTEGMYRVCVRVCVCADAHARFSSARCGLVPAGVPARWSNSKSQCSREMFIYHLRINRSACVRACIVRRAYKFHERATHSVRDVCGNGFIAATSNAAQIPVITVCGSCVKPALCAFANYTIKKHTLTNGVKILLPPHIRLTPPTRPAIFAEQLSRFTVLPRQKQHTQQKKKTTQIRRIVIIITRMRVCFWCTHVNYVEIILCTQQAGPAHRLIYMKRVNFEDAATTSRLCIYTYTCVRSSGQRFLTCTQIRHLAVAREKIHTMSARLSRSTPDQPRS